MRIQTALAVGGLMALTLWAYHDAVPHQFVYEDLTSVAASAGVEPYPVNRRSLVRWTWSDDPVTVHRVNLALHVATGLVVGALAGSLGFASPLVACGWFLLAPLQSEAVNYGASRGDLLATFGIVLACWAASRLPAPWTVLAGLGGAIVAVLAKEVGFLVVPLVGLTWAVQGRITPPRTKALLAVGLLAVPLLGLLLRVNAAADVSPWWWLLTQSNATMRLLALSVSGVGMTIDPDVTLMTWGVTFCAAGLVTLFVLGLRYGSPRVRFCVLWVAICVVPRLIVRTPGSVFNEHQFFLPMIGMSLLVSEAVDFVFA